MSLLGRPGWECGPDDMGRSDAITVEVEDMMDTLSGPSPLRETLALSLATAIEEQYAHEGSDLVGLLAKLANFPKEERASLQVRIADAMAEVFAEVARNLATEIVDDRVRLGSRMREAA